jgi:DNA-directed RNA polymerase subunit K
MIWPEDVLTRFEVARLVGARALQIALGAPLLVEGKKTASPAELAKLEFKKKIVPITVKRKMPDGTVSVIKAKRAIDNWLKEHNGEI